MKHLFFLLTVTSGAAFAQATGTVDPSPPPAESSKEEDVPPGGCMPMGLTVSGKLVFPIQCKELVERYLGKAVEQKPAAAEERPGVSPPARANSDAHVKPAQTARQSEGVVPEHSKPAIKPVETDPLPTRRAALARRAVPADKFKSAFWGYVLYGPR
jgi:hypothetical protein